VRVTPDGTEKVLKLQSKRERLRSSRLEWPSGRPRGRSRRPPNGPGDASVPIVPPPGSLP